MRAIFDGADFSDVLSRYVMSVERARLVDKSWSGIKNMRAPPVAYAKVYYGHHNALQSTDSSKRYYYVRDSGSIEAQMLLSQEAQFREMRDGHVLTVTSR